MRKYMFFTGFAMGPFIYFAKEKKNKLFLLPTIAVFIGGKYYMDSKLDQKLRQNNLNENYFLGSRELEQLESPEIVRTTEISQEAAKKSKGCYSD